MPGKKVHNTPTKAGLRAGNPQPFCEYLEFYAGSEVTDFSPLWQSPDHTRAKCPGIAGKLEFRAAGHVFNPLS